MMFQGKLDRRIVRIQSKGLLDLEAWRLEIVGLKNIEIQNYQNSELSEFGTQTLRFRNQNYQNSELSEFGIQRLDFEIQKLELLEFKIVRIWNSEVRLKNSEIRITQNLKLLRSRT